MALLRFSIPSRVLKVPVEIRVSLPDSGSGFRTLWVLHGANCDCNEWFDDSNAVQVTRDHGFALVSVSIFNGFGVNMCYGLPYADFLENEWLPAVRSLFPCLSQRREDNLIAGASMGGFAAFRLAMNRPEWFCGAGAFAGAVALPTIIERYQRGVQVGGPDLMYAFGSYENLVNNSNDVVWMTRCRVSEGVCPSLYMVCGTEDFGYALNTIARDDLRQAGAQVAWRQGEGIHSFTCWNLWTEDFMQWAEQVCRDARKEVSV